MSQVPARLVYEDSNNNDVVIGSFLPQDVTDGNISTFTLDGEAENYKRVIIEGGPTLEDNMPVQQSEFGTSEPEIRVQVDTDLDGTWEDRMRVYPEESGTTNDRGRYKNKNLWGFKKFYGEGDVSTGTITTDLTDALDALLPSGYVARYPGDETAPNVTNYSYNGSRQQGFKELQRHYDHFIIFTNETDGGGNYYVDLQPFGYGGVQFSLTRGQDSLVYDYWKKNDLANVVSKVNVVGKDSTNSKIDVTRTAADIGETADRERFRRVHVDYTITSTEAQNIADNILQPSGVEQGAIETSLDASSNLNDSVGILDESRGIDDVFTVVKQKDFLHQGVSLFSFEYEQESTQRQRDKWREHDNTRARVYPESTENQNVGPIDIDDTATDTELVQDQYDADAQNNHGHGNSNVTSNANQLRTLLTNSKSRATAFTGGGTQDNILSATMPGASITGGIDFTYAAVDLFISPSASGTVEVEIENITDNTVLETDSISTSSNTNLFVATDPDVSIPAGAGDEIAINITQNSASADIEASITLTAQQNHDHFVNLDPTQGEVADLTINVNTSDGAAGDTSQLTVSGQTVQELIEILTTTEDKTDR